MVIQEPTLNLNIKEENLLESKKPEPNLSQAETKKVKISLSLYENYFLGRKSTEIEICYFFSVDQKVV